MRKILLLSTLTLLAFFTENIVNAQNIADYEFQASIESYQEITGGTVVTNSSSVDDYFYTGNSIGFDFVFGGQIYNEIGISTNGFASFSNVANNITYPLFNDQDNSLSPLSGDLQAQNGASITTKTIGSAPNRVFVVQWKNYRWYDLTVRSYNFQLRLYETSNTIEFHYGNFVSNGTSSQRVQVSINRDFNDFINITGPDWSDWTTTNRVRNNAQSSGTQLGIDAIPTNDLLFSFIPPVVDLGINLFPNVAELCADQEYYYAIEVANSSALSTSDIEAEFEIPTGTSFVSASANYGTYNENTGIYSISNLPENTTAVLEVIVKVNAGMEGSTVNANAEILSAATDDPNLSNNSSSVALSVGNNSSPQLSDISNQTAPYNGVSAPIPFTVSDVETAASDLIISVTSSNQTLLPNTNIGINGASTNRELVLQPALNQFGTTTITVEVSDGICPIIKTFEVEVFKQTFGNFEAAKIVVGQADFNSNSTSASRIVAPGSNSSAVSVKGVLAVGSQTTNRVLIWNSVPTSDGEAADIVVGQSNFTNTGESNSQSRLRAPDGVAFSPDGNKLLVADAGNNRILIWNSIPTSNNQDADIILGQTNWTNRTSGTSTTKFDRPTDIQFTASGKMIVTDRNNDRVLIYNKIPTANNTPADVVIGQADFTSGTQATAANRLREPWNTSVAPDGKLLIADDGNNRVLVYNTIPTTNGASADLVIGQTDFFNNGAGSSDDGFSSPGVTVSPSGVVAIADFNNHRALIFNEIPTTNGASADVVLGQRNFNETASFNNGNGATGTPSNRNMSQPYGINFDLNERLYINGRGMNRMMIFGETPSQVSDLSISFDSDSNSPCVNSVVSYTVQVTNNGPNNATNVVVTSALPYGFTPTDAQPQLGSYNQESGYWQIPMIKNGETISLTMTGTVNLGQNSNTITAYAGVRSYNQNDPDFSNNAGSVIVIIENNEAPSISNVDDVIMELNTTSPNINFTIGDDNTNLNALGLVATSSDQGLVKDASITIGGSGSNRFLKVTPESGQFGMVTISITVDDGTCSTTESFDLFVGNVWLGNTSAWNTASNWSTGVPTDQISAVIPNNPLGGSFPVVNAAADVKNIIINKNAYININAGRTLNVHGDFTNLGTTLTGNGNIRMIGTVPQWIMGYVSGLIIDNTSGILLADNLVTTRSINLAAGQMNVGNNSLTIRNPIIGTPNNLRMDATSSLIVQGTASGISIPSSISTLGDLELNNGSGLTLNNSLQITDSLKLYTGTFALGSNSIELLGFTHSTNGKISSSNGAELSIVSNGDAGKLVYDNSLNDLANLTIDVTAGSFTIENTVVVNTQLALTNGRLISTNGFIHVANTNQDALLVSSSAYIAGALRRCVTTGIEYELPIGTIDYKESVIIDFNSMSASTCIDVFFTESPTDPDFIDIADLNISVDGNVVEQLLDYGFWTITPTNSGVYNYNISTTSQGHTNGNEDGNHILLKRDNASSDWAALGNHSSDGEGGNFANPITVSRSNLTGFSDFAIGASSMGPLPISLLHFDAEQKQKGVLLKWATASEKNNSHFEVQKSANGRDFEILGLIEGNGNSSTLVNYEFTDKGAHGNVSYYRLQQFDFDGKSTFSDIIKVAFETGQFNVSLYPNPASHQIKINFEEEVATSHIQFVNTKGQIVKKVQTQGGRNIELDVSDLANGYYQIIIRSQTKTGMVSSAIKFVKK